MKRFGSCWSSVVLGSRRSFLVVVILFIYFLSIMIYVFINVVRRGLWPTVVGRLSLIEDQRHLHCHWSLVSGYWSFVVGRGLLLVGRRHFSCW